MIDFTLVIAYLKTIPLKYWLIVVGTCSAVLVLCALCTPEDNEQTISIEMVEIEESKDNIQSAKKNIDSLKVPNKKEILNNSSTKINEEWDNDSPHID